PDRDRPGRIHPGERAARECDRSGGAPQRERRLRRDAGPCRGLRDQWSHALRIRRRPRIVSRGSRNHRVPGRSARCLRRRWIAGPDPIREREACGEFGEPESVRAAPHRPPDRRPTADALHALPGRLGLRPAGSLDRHERNGAQAVALALAGAILGSALGIVTAHAVVSFAPLAGLPNLVILSPPTAAVGLALLISGVAAVLAGLVPSRRAAVLIRTKGAIPS